MAHLGQNLIPEFVVNKHHQQKYAGDFKAAAIFVDISGFTTLTETFLEHHREGAEALTQVLFKIFNPQIEILYQRGGFIPFFAGDAFVGIFPYDDEDFGQKAAALQAVKTAVQIQAFFNEQNHQRTFQTPHGTFGVAVKIGLSFGQIRWGISGYNKQLFYFRGEAIKGCADAQNEAQPGQIVLDDALLSFVAGQTTYSKMDQSGYHLLLEDKSPPIDPTPYENQIVLSDLIPFLPDQIIHLPVNEFREVSTIFVSFEAPEETAVFHQIITKVAELVEEFGGYLNQIDVSDKGSIFVILFGAPIAYENNLLRAAGFLQAMKSASFNISWRAGVTYGLLWSGIRGGRERSEYGVVGNEINLASRLAMKAEWGEIWVSDVVYRELKDAYLFHSLGKMKLKGKSFEIPIYKFMHQYDSSDINDYQGKIIGRDAELTQLEKFTNQVFTEKNCKLVYIFGDIGVGKTRLVFELRRRVLYKYFPQTFYCQADEIQKTTLNPFKRLIRHHFGLKFDFKVEMNKYEFNRQFDFLLTQLPTDNPETKKISQELERTRSILGAMADLYWEDSLYENLAPQLRFENTINAFINFIKAAALIRPLILHIEDAQWLDENSKQLLEALTYSLKGYPVLLICTCRYQDDGSRIQFSVSPDIESIQLNLQNLDTQNIVSMAQEYLKSGVSTDIGAFLFQKTNGNPFFVEQLIEDLRERDAFMFSDEGEATRIKTDNIKIEDIPTTVNTLLLSRLDRLDYQVKQVVRAASVLGHEFELPILDLMLGGQDNLQQLIDQAEKQQIWFAQSRGIYQFKHALLRDASYAMQLKSNIREQHRLARNAIEQVYLADLSSHYSELALHADKGEQFDLAVEWYHRSGEQSASQYANSEALTYLDRALHILDSKDSEREFELRLIRERILGIQGIRDEQKAELEKLSQLADAQNDLKKQTAVAHLQAKLAEATGDYQNSLLFANKTADLARESHDTDNLVAALLLQGKVHFRLGEYQSAHHWLKQGLAEAQINNLPDYEAHSLRQIGIVLVDEGHFAEAKPYYENALTIYREMDDKTGIGTALNNLGVLHWNSGDLLEAEAYYNQAAEIYEEIGYRRGENMVLMNLGLVASKYGDYERAIRFYEQTLENLTEINERFGICFVQMNLADVYIKLSQYDQAHEYGRRVYQLADEIGAKRIAGMALMLIGTVLRHKQKIYGAEKAFQDALSLWQQMKQTNLEIEALIGLSLLSLDKDEPECAQTHVERILAYFEEDQEVDTKVDNIIDIFHNCYYILTQLEDHRAAAILHKAHDILQQNAAKIIEPTIRERFLNNVPVHQQIIAAHEKIQSITAPPS